MIGALSTKQQFLLSKFLNALNEEWDIAGIEHALGRAREMAPGPELACAAIRAATTVGNRTPAVIALPGPHWRAAAVTVRVPSVAAGERCSVCSHPQAMCRALHDDHDHKFQSVTDARREAARFREAQPDVVKQIQADLQAKRGAEHVVADDDQKGDA